MALPFYEELNIIKLIARANGYKNLMIDKLSYKRRKFQAKPKRNLDTQKNSRNMFLLNSTDIVSNIMKNTYSEHNAIVTYITINSIHRILGTKPTTPIEKNLGKLRNTL